MSVSHVTLLRIYACAATAAALFIITWVAASTPSADAKRLGLRGLKRQRALETVPMWSTLEPLLRWIGARFSGLVSVEWKRNLDLKIALAGDFLGFCRRRRSASASCAALAVRGQGRCSVGSRAWAISSFSRAV